MEYRCPKCSAVLNKYEDKYICEYCKSEIDIEYFNNDIKVDYIIPFKITKNDAIRIYNNSIKSRLLTPTNFKSKKLINKIKGVYIPCYIYDIDSTGVVEFDADKINTWKSSGINYKKTDLYKVIRGGNISLKNILFSKTTRIDNETLNLIEPYNYNELIPFSSSYIENYEVYKCDKTKNSLLEDINSKAKNIFIREFSKDIKNYNNIEPIENSINIYNPNRRYILIPLWILTINYKNKRYEYIINGQTGSFKGRIPINYKKIISIWIILFLIIFFILLLLNLYQVML